MRKIYLCSGSERPRTVGDVLKTQLGSTTWEGQKDVTIKANKSGLAVWLVYVDGLDVRAVAIKPPAAVPSDTTITANIMSKPKLIFNPDDLAR